MINLDAILLDFIEQNTVTCILIFGFLKVLAQHSKNTIDDSVIDYLLAFVTRKPSIVKKEKIEIEEYKNESEKNIIP